MTFPTDWAEGCPPPDAPAGDGVIYRIVKANPPAASDFLSFVEEGRPLRRPTPCPCMPYGLSVFPDRADAVWMSRSLPRLGKYLAKGTLGAADGCCKLTPGQRPTHTTWWPSCECARAGLFTEVEDAV
jgi:hypothetical protein